MNSNEEDPPSLEQASTVLDALRTEPGSFQSNRPVTVIGPSLRFSPRAELTGFEEKAFADRYTKTGALGEGGMGEVRLCHDARLGRDVAMKVIRIAHGARADYRARFLREVRVQGQLEHPSIVPVYDLGIGADGATYFTMKRVRGLTLADIFDRLRGQDPEVVAQYTQRRLLTAFQSVCLAVEFAHSRGVIHRDLKPQNVMLGDFGEVYVLDWGIAKIVSEPDDPATEEAAAASQKFVDSTDTLETQVGTFVGSLGYLSPEQFSGEDLDSRSDVFSLGAILFEMLTLKPLFEGSSMQVAQALAEPVDARCSVRTPDREIPPELEQICVMATQLEREGRYGSPRQLNDAIGGFLDGDRDLEQRKILAAKHLESAELAIDAIRADRAQAVAHRAKALGELGRALALDPTNEGALGDIVTLFLEPPSELPKEVRADIEKSRQATVRSVAMTGLKGFPIGLLMLMPVLISMGITNWTTIAVIATCMIFISVLCALQLRRSSDWKSYVIMTGAAIAFVAVSRIFGPLVLLPQMAMSTSMIYSMHPSKRVQLASST
ncbi:MAG: serine/threonine-protein kinase, partial [Polyangiaceae bacterium]